MINSSYYLTFMFTGAAIAAAPGPNLLYIVSQSLRFGHWLSVPCALGMVAASFVYAALAVGGASAVLYAYPSLLIVAKVAGACYLLRMAYNQFTNSPVIDEVKVDNAGSSGQRFTSGFIIGMSNPKTMFFYLTFIPQFVDPLLPVQPQLIIYNITQLMVLSTITLSYAFAASPIRVWLRKPERITILNKSVATILASASMLMIGSVLLRN